MCTVIDTSLLQDMWLLSSYLVLKVDSVKVVYVSKIIALNNKDKYFLGNDSLISHSSYII